MVVLPQYLPPLFRGVSLGDQHSASVYLSIHALIVVSINQLFLVVTLSAIRVNTRHRDSSTPPPTVTYVAHFSALRRHNHGSRERLLPYATGILSVANVSSSNRESSHRHDVESARTHAHARTHTRAKQNSRRIALQFVVNDMCDYYGSRRHCTYIVGVVVR
jgi:ABC-type nickel/cobalt efflux system permease component RcnA